MSPRRPGLVDAAMMGVGLGALAVAAREQGQIGAAVTLDLSVTILQMRHKDLMLLSNTRTEKDTRTVLAATIPAARSTPQELDR